MKKGQITIPALIAIILGILVLVLLILGFSTGWSNLWDKINIFGGGKVNVDSIRQACSLACMQQGAYSFCSQERELTIEKRKTIKGSCFDFATKNPSLEIENCDICSGTSSACKIENNIDKNCDGVAEETSSESGLFTESQQLYYFLDTGGTTSIEGKPDINKRKEELNIPNDLCYWNSMEEIYKEKCADLSESEIKEIFEKKKVYREENTPDWAVLNSEGDFCVPLVFDYDEWEEETKIMSIPAAGLFDGNKNKIYLNPNLDWKRENLRRVLLHEGLHSIQIKKEGNVYLGSEKGEGLNFFKEIEITLSKESSKIECADKISSICKKVNQTHEEIENELEKKYEETQSNFLEKIKEIRTQFLEKQISKEDFLKEESRLSGIFKEEQDNYFDEQDNRITAYQYLCDLYSVSISAGMCPEEETIQKLIERYLNGAYSSSDSLKEKITSSFKELKSGYYSCYLKMNEAITKSYIGSKIELDPRLSEVQRWWLDTHNCEIIYTKEKAKEALNIFLSAENLSNEYEKTRLELKLLLDVYKGTEYEQQIYNQLITRLPGLAMTDSQDDGTAIA